MAEHREVDMVRPPRVVMIAPWIGARLHRDEAVIALLIRDGPARPSEVWIKRRRMLVDIVHVTTAGVRLPDFHQRIGNRAFVFVQNVAVHDDPFAERLAFVLLCQIRIAFLYRVVAVNRSGAGDPKADGTPAAKNRRLRFDRDQ